MHLPEIPPSKKQIQPTGKGDGGEQSRGQGHALFCNKKVLEWSVFRFHRKQERFSRFAYDASRRFWLFSFRLRAEPRAGLIKTLGHVFAANRQAAHSLAGGAENSVTDGGRTHRNGWLFRAGHEINFNRRSLVHADHRIIVEIGLHDPAAIHGDGVFDRSSERINSGAFHLGAYAVGIDGPAAIHGANDAIYLESRASSGDFRNRRDITKERVEGGNAAALPFGKGLVPAGLFRGQSQNALQARGVERMIVLPAFSKLGNSPRFAD